MSKFIVTKVVEKDEFTQTQMFFEDNLESANKKVDSLMEGYTPINTEINSDGEKTVFGEKGDENAYAFTFNNKGREGTWGE